MRFFGLVLIFLSTFTLTSYAQESVSEIPVQTANNAILRSGPGDDTLWLEYLAVGRTVLAAGRNADTTWIEINDINQNVGWVPVETLINNTGIEFTRLPVKGGLRSSGSGRYDVTSPAFRAVQVDLILIQRPLYQIGGRYFRLQGFLNASCQNLPTPPASPTISDAEIGAVPELERVLRELTFVQEQTIIAIDKYAELCEEGGTANESVYQDGLNALNNAYDALNVVRRFVEELTGLVFMAP